jgi:deoxyribodipyrimidine photo-lyase
VKSHPIAVYWFRRSIRLDDNRALLRACRDGQQVIPVFILDPTLLSHPTTGRARTHFLFESLVAVDAALRQRGGRLIVRHGQPVEELTRLVQETGATLLCFSRDYEPYSRQRDTVVTAAMQALGVAVETESDLLLSEPGEILTRTKNPYTVFTPYKRVWWEYPMLPVENAPERILTPETVTSQPLPTMDQFPIGGNSASQKPLVHGGEAEANRLLEAFLTAKVENYDSGRESPAEEGTSRLSAYLKMGVISPRRLLAGVQAMRLASMNTGRENGYTTFLSELAWRDFYYQILWHFPQVTEGAFRKEYNDIAWENREAFFAAWCEGRTGYPIVDAAQRQLNTEAWMHNRSRMITASFLTKDLLCNWQWGERYFMQKLIDGDLAANNGGWQWAASTGTDAQPFFRIFNPVSQGEKFDPDGTYVKRYVPELRRIPAKYIHRPWELSPSEQEAVGCVLGRDYPHPIVDHKVQRERALALYRAANGTAK